MGIVPQLELSFTASEPESIDPAPDIFVRKNNYHAPYLPARKRGEDDETVFWTRVRVGEPDECWPYLGRVDKDGYGVFPSRRFPGNAVRAHRYAYLLKCGPIPDGLFVCHTCDQPVCVNPAHFWLGTSADNTADKMKKGRHRVLSGGACPSSKLTEAQVREIFELLRDTNPTERIGDIAARYGVTQSNISAIYAGKSWAHIRPPDLVFGNRDAYSLRRGDHSSLAKLSTDDVIEIRRLFREENYYGLVMDLANRYGVSMAAISAVRDRITWKHITP